MQVLDSEGLRNSADAAHIWWIVDRTRYIFNDQDQFSEWLKLRNIDEARASANDQIDTITYAANNIHAGARVFVQHGDDFTPQLDPPGSGSVAKAHNDYQTAKQEYQDEKDSFDADDYEIWPARVRENRVSVTKGDAFVWHSGEIFDFGGCWNYNLGNGYEENFIASQDIDQIKDGGFDHDLLSVGGPDWYKQSNPWTSDVNSVIVSALSGNKNDQGLHQMAVSKTIGDTYDYQKGAALDVQVGPSLSVKKGGPNVSKVFIGNGDDPDILMEHVEAADGVTKTWKNHKYTGTPLYYGIEEWTTGKHSFSAEFAPSQSLDIKCAMTQSNEMTLGFSANTAINVGASIDIELYAGLKTAISASASAEIELNAFAAAKMDLTTGTGSILEVNNYVGAKVEVDIPAPELKVTVAGATLENVPDSFLIRAPVGVIALSKVEIENGTMKLASKGIEMKA